MTSTLNKLNSKDFSIGYLLISFFKSWKALGWKSYLLNSWTDHRLGDLDYRQWLWLLSQSHWAGILWLVLVSVLSFVAADFGIWAPIWRMMIEGLGLELTLFLTDGRLSSVTILGLVTYGISFFFGIFGIGAIWFALLVPALLYANLVSTAFAISGLFWCWSGHQLALLCLGPDPIYRRDFSRIFFLSLIGALMMTYFSLVLRDIAYQILRGALFHSPTIRFTMWLFTSGLGLVLLSFIHALFFHFYFQKYATQETSMSWQIWRPFFWRIGGIKAKRNLLRVARTRLAEQDKIEQDLDEPTRTKMPLAILNRWQAERKSLKVFIDRFSER